MERFTDNIETDLPSEKGLELINALQERGIGEFLHGEASCGVGIHLGEGLHIHLMVTDDDVGCGKMWFYLLEEPRKDERVADRDGRHSHAGAGSATESSGV